MKEGEDSLWKEGWKTSATFFSNFLSLSHWLQVPLPLFFALLANQKYVSFDDYCRQVNGNLESKGSPFFICGLFKWALPVRGGGVNDCSDGLGHFFVQCPERLCTF